MKIYGIKSCISVRNALCYLDALDFEYEFIDYKKNPLSKSDIIKILKHIPLNKMFNMQSRVFKNLNLSEKLTDYEKIELMVEYPSIIKRPLLVYNDIILADFKEEEYQTLK